MKPDPDIDKNPRLLDPEEELHRSSDLPIWLENFTNLAKAYEHKLNESEQLILPNKMRSQLLARLLGTPPSEAYFIVQGLARCQAIEGDICEFGVAQGETSALIANEMASLSSHKILHLFDSFAGLPTPSSQDQLIDDIFALGNMEAYAGKMKCREDMVLARFQELSFPAQRYVIHKGFFDQLIDRDKNLPQKVSFAYVDFDFYEPIKQVLEFLHPITSRGAMILVDDYGFFSTGAKTAVDEFLQGKNASEICYECLIPNIEYGHFAVLTKTS
jgi:O-methyltransferase